TPSLLLLSSLIRVDRRPPAPLLPYLTPFSSPPPWPRAHPARRSSDLPSPWPVTPPLNCAAFIRLSSLTPTTWLQPCGRRQGGERSEEHTSELQSRFDLVCRRLLEKKKRQVVVSYPILYIQKDTPLASR